MPPRWNPWTTHGPVRFDYESEPKQRSMRIASPALRVGEPVRIGVSGVEVEGTVVAIENSNTIVVTLKARPAKAEPRTKTRRRA